MLPVLRDAANGEVRITAGARDTAEYLSKRIVLIDGGQLTRLMISHNVGCRIEENLHVRKVDEVFFE